MVVLDTNVVSELMRDDPHADVLRWLDDRPTRELFVTGIALLSAGRRRRDRPSCVRSATKSYAQTWCRCSGRWRMHEPSASHNRPRFGYFCGTLRPSRRQSRSMRL